jgi:hypothetical protein
MANSDFNIWYKSNKESFLYINERSNIPDKWLDYEEILKIYSKESIIKPINLYMHKLCPPPKLVSIINNEITLCQENFAEIFLLKKRNGASLRSIEKIHMRQFYLSDISLGQIENCFDPVYRWAMPWFIDCENLKIDILPVENSPFYFYEHSYFSQKNKQKRIDPEMLLFKFKNNGVHMIDDEYGRIKRGFPAYLIKFQCNDIMLRQIKETYEKI